MAHWLAGGRVSNSGAGCNFLPVLQAGPTGRAPSLRPVVPGCVSISSVLPHSSIGCHSCISRHLGAGALAVLLPVGTGGIYKAQAPYHCRCTKWCYQLYEMNSIRGVVCACSIESLCSAARLPCGHCCQRPLLPGSLNPLWLLACLCCAAVRLAVLLMPSYSDVVVARHAPPVTAREWLGSLLMVLRLPKLFSSAFGFRWGGVRGEGISADKSSSRILVSAQ